VPLVFLLKKKFFSEVKNSPLRPVGQASPVFTGAGSPALKGDKQWKNATRLSIKENKNKQKNIRRKKLFLK
jgi:hypothetical protein